MKTKVFRIILIVMGLLYIPAVFLVPFGQRKTVSDAVSSTVSGAVGNAVGDTVANVIGDAVSDMVEDALPDVPDSVEKLCPEYLTAFSALRSISEVTLAVKMGELMIYYVALFLVPAVCGLITVLLNAIGRKRPSYIATIVLCVAAAVFFGLTEYNMAARFSVLYKDTLAAVILCVYAVIQMVVAIVGCVLVKPQAAEKTPWADSGSGDMNFALAGGQGGYAAEGQPAGPGGYAAEGLSAGPGGYASGGSSAGPGGYASGGSSAGPEGSAAGGLSAGPGGFAAGGSSAGPAGFQAGGQGALHGLTGDYMDADIPLDPGVPVMIGSDPKVCSVVLVGGDISGKHLVVQWMGNGNYQVTDYSYLGSFDQYGNRLPTASAVTMHSGDTVRVGSEAFRLV